MTPQQHLSAALDALAYQATINRVFAADEFSTIKAHLDAVSAYLEAQDESYFEDGADFDSLLDDEQLRENDTLPTVATLITGTESYLYLQFSDKFGVWDETLSASEKAINAAKELKTRGVVGVEVVYDSAGVIVDVAELPF